MSPSPIERIRNGTLLSMPGETTLRFLYAAAAIFVTLVILSTADKMVNLQVQQSDDVLWQVAPVGEEFHLMVVAVGPGGVGATAGIQQGDRVVAINGVNLPTSEVVSDFGQQLLNNAPTDRLIPYIVEREGELVSLSIQLAEVYPVALLVYPIFGLLWLFVGLIAALARPTGRVQRLFFLTGLTIFFVVSRSTSTDLPIIILWNGAGLLFFFFWIRFTDTFPVNQGIFRSPLRATLMILPLVLTVGSFIGFAFSGMIGLNSYQIFSTTLIALYGLTYGTGIVLLFRGYRLMEEEVNRRPMQIIILGTLITTLSILYVSVSTQSTSSFSALDLEFLLTSIPIIALPLAFGYAIFRYQVMDVRAIFRVALVYAITTGMIVGLYLFLALYLGRFLGQLFGLEKASVIETMILLLFVLLFEPVRRRVSRLVEERFFPEFSDYSKKVTAYMNNVSGEIGVDRVAIRLRETLRKELTLDPVELILFNEEGHGFRPDETRETPLELSENDMSDLRRMTRGSTDLIPLSTSPISGAKRAFEQDFDYVTALLSGGRVIGLLLLGGRSDGRTIHGSQIPFLKSIAGQTASAIEAERLYSGELERRSYLQELATAQRIQESLLPSSPPEVEGLTIAALSRPARTVGGDYYEVIRLSEKRLLVMIADVSGKGLPASLYMAELHGMVRIVATISDSPAGMLRILNRRLVDVLERGTFVTASIGIIDMETQVLRLARAGHTPLLHLRNGTLAHYTPQGLPLGVPTLDLFDEKTEEVEIALKRGDRLLLYSDGLSEGMNEAREEYGTERMEELFVQRSQQSASATVSALLSDVEEFQGSAEQNDDITLLMVEVSEEGDHLREEDHEG